MNPTSPCQSISTDDAPAYPMTLKRVVYVALGITFVGIGIVGVMLPGIPTTGPLMLASFLLARSNPRLEQKLLGLRIFRNYRPYLDGSAPMPMRARLWALAMMWGSILLSCLMLTRTSGSSAMLIAAIMLAGCVGTVVILVVRRKTHADPGEGDAFPADFCDTEDGHEQGLTEITETIEISSPATASTHRRGSAHHPPRRKLVTTP